MISEFAKQDFGQGIDLEGVFSELGANMSDEGFWSNMMEQIKQLAEVEELKGYYAYRIQTSGRSYYPVRGSIRMLPTGQALFAETAYDSGDGRPVYVTLERDAIESVYWIPEPQEEAEEDALPEAA